MVRQKIDYANNRDYYESITLMKAQGFIDQILERDGVSQNELAERLGKTKGSISRLLSDGRNLTLRSFGGILHALGVEVRFSENPIKGNLHNTNQDPCEEKPNVEPPRIIKSVEYAPERTKDWDAQKNSRTHLKLAG